MRSAAHNLVGGWLLSAFGVVSTPVDGATFAVNTTFDLVDLSPGDGECRANPTGAALCTLRAAIQESNALSGSDVVSLPSGTFVLGLPGAGEDSGATGDLDVTASMAISGAGAASTILDGGDLDRVFHVLSTGPGGVEIADLTIRGGRVIGDTGGSVLNQGRLTMSGCHVVDSSAYAGGGVANVGPPGAATPPRLAITVSTISGNDAELGGGIFNSAGGTARVPGLTLSGSVVSANSASSNGGGIYTASPIRVEGTDVTSNSALFHGGGIAALGTSSVSVSMVDVEISGNTATLGSGGGVYNQGGVLSVIGGEILANAATGIVAGGIYHAGDTLTLTDSVVADNEAPTAGGVFTIGTATFTDTTIVDNAATSTGPVGRGGGVFVAGGELAAEGGGIIGNTTASEDADAGGGGLFNDGGSVLLLRLELSGNVSSGHGGGLHNRAGTSVLDRVTVAGNTVLTPSTAAHPYGGGVYNRDELIILRSTLSGNGVSERGGGIASEGGWVHLENSSVSGNVAGLAGGGVTIADGGALMVQSSTIAENVAVLLVDAGGVEILFPASATLADTVIAGNVALGGPRDCGGGGLAGLSSAGHNLDSDGTCQLLAALGDLPATDPMLGPLGDHGGATRTHALLPGSPAIDAAGASCPTEDQRGVARPQDGDGDGAAVCDIGAFEVCVGPLCPAVFADGFESGDLTLWSAAVP